jgi:WD40 repeat protein
MFNNRGSAVKNVFMLPGQKLISVSEDYTVSVWKISESTHSANSKLITAPISDTELVSPGQLAVWRQDIWTEIPMPEKLSPLNTSRTDLVPEIWSIDSGRALETLKDTRGCITQLCTLTDELHISLSEHGEVKAWKTLSEGKSRAYSIDCAGIDRILAVDDRRFAALSSNAIQIWDVEYARLLGTCFGKYDGISQILEIDDEHYVSWHKNTIKLWDISVSKCLGSYVATEPGCQLFRVLVIGKDRIVSISGSPDPYKPEMAIRVWEFKRHQDISRLGKIDHSIWCTEDPVRLSGDNLLFKGAVEFPTTHTWGQSTGSNTENHGTLNLLDPQFPELLTSFDPYEHKEFKILPSGLILTWGGGTIGLWDSGSFSCLHTIEVPESYFKVKILSDSLAATYSDTSNLRVWDLHSGDLRATYATIEYEIKAIGLISENEIVTHVRQGPEEYVCRWGPANLPLDKIPVEKVPYAHPRWIIALTSSLPVHHTTGESSSGWANGKAATVFKTPSQVPTAATWHGDGKLEIRNVLDDGTVVMIEGGNEIRCLKLYSGSRRVRLKELNDG